MGNLEWHQGDFTLSDDKSKLDIEAILSFLSRAYWAQGRKREVIERSIQNSICFGIYAAAFMPGPQMVAFARVVSDCATFAYLCDVFVDEAYRGRGLGKWLISGVMAHPDLQGVRRWSLATRDAHGLYRQFGWSEIKSPERWMEIVNSMD